MIAFSLLNEQSQIPIPTLVVVLRKFNPHTICQNLAYNNAFNTPQGLQSEF